MADSFWLWEADLSPPAPTANPVVVLMAKTEVESAKNEETEDELLGEMSPKKLSLPSLNSLVQSGLLC